MGGGDAGQAAGEVRQARQARAAARPSPSASGQAAQGGRGPTRRQAVGRWGEDQALACLQARGLRLVQRNFRAPGRGGGEIDLVMQAGDGTLVFVEVRVRRASGYGGAGASIDARKRARIALAAQHFLTCWPGPAPACRFDVVLIDGQGQPPAWVQGAFDGGQGGHGAW
ncbi:MAG: YraN family protein [Comamonadaceae bacterium]|nr:YraN family protein [Comamonadaceae bacterium]